jgi:hypothetical protein
MAGIRNLKRAGKSHRVLSPLVSCLTVGRNVVRDLRERHPSGPLLPSSLDFIRIGFFDHTGKW